MVNCIRRHRHLRRGAAVVETAVVAPLLILGMLGMMEVGWAFMLRQTVTLAAREGARAGSLPGATLADVTSAVDASMGAANLEGYTIDTNIANLGPADLDVTVTVSIPLDRATFTGSMIGGGSFTIGSTTTMRREGIDAGQGVGGVDP
ncbi:MAG: pilus assembly protein [Phycisphaerales bacterium]|nr:pilus assembly protein [Phycisphaerales bacterium]MCB9857949.1 pilus assembly protein [Phycisphaerales bacterium]